MTASKQERQLYGSNVQVTIREDDCTIYRITDASGDAILTRYEIYPGISLVYNDVHRQEISIEEPASFQNIYEINHCREGRIEFESSSGEALYIKKGDMAINEKNGVKNESFFPQSHYHGVTIEINLDIVAEQPNKSLQELGIDVAEMRKRFCKDHRCFVLHEKAEFEHLFTELYRVPETIRGRYYKLKVMEILLFLSAIDVKSERIENRYFNKNTEAVIKQVHAYMLDHFDEKLTIDGLSQQFDISSTNLKKHFREIYGNSIYAYLKEYRIQKATEYMRTTDMEIGKIAGLVGYDNASKFATSFKAVIGINPRDYKKNV